MKRTLLIFFALLLGASVAMADNVVPVATNRLPYKAQQALKTYWPNAAVMSAMKKTAGKNIDYKVSLEDGTVIRFDAQGNWRQIKCYTGLPDKVMPDAMRHHIKTYYDGQYPVEINKGKKKYRIQLNQGMYLEYDLKGNFLRF